MVYAKMNGWASVLKLDNRRVSRTQDTPVLNDWHSVEQLMGVVAFTPWQTAAGGGRGGRGKLWPERMSNMCSACVARAAAEAPSH